MTEVHDERRVIGGLDPDLVLAGVARQALGGSADDAEHIGRGRPGRRVEQPEPGAPDVLGRRVAIRR